MWCVCARIWRTAIKHWPHTYLSIYTAVANVSQAYGVSVCNNGCSFVVLSCKKPLSVKFCTFFQVFFFFGGVTGFMNWKWISACLTLVVWFMEIGMAAELSDWTETVAEVGCFDQKDCAVVFKLFLDSNEQSQTRDTSHTVMSSTSIGYVRHHIHSLTHIPGFPLYLVQWFLKVGSRNLKGVPRADQLKKQ